ncbi:MAG: TetR/AcrR family transcriptional regulator [Cyclobacteriaceae bacterium]
MKSRKEYIKECAARLFREKGYKATSMRDIAQVVGMEAASLYNHIKSKQELFQEMLLHMAHLFTKGMDEISDSSYTPLIKLEKLISMHVKFAVEYTDSISLITNEWVHLEGDAKSEFSELRDTYEKKFEQIIKDCVSEGYFAPVNTEIALFSILSTLRWLYSWYSKNKNMNPVELEKEFIHCLLDGLKKK